MPLKTEHEKMLAGERYNFFDAELTEMRRATEARLWRYNQTETRPERAALLPHLVGQVGQDSIIEAPFFCTYGKHIRLGDHVFLNVGCTILDNNTVQIGNYVMVGPSVQFYTAAHPLEAEERIQGWENALPIVVEDKVWIGGGAILLPGVRVGQQAVVGAGAVVTRDVPPYTVVAGNPARVIKELRPTTAA